MLAMLCVFLADTGIAGYPEVPLPPLAKAGKVDAGKKSWRQSGEISGSVALVQQEFSAALARGGWVLQKSIGLGKGPKRSGLTLWSKGGKKMLLMIWEKHAGRCGFSWGFE
jgi:hypothetical protein